MTEELVDCQVNYGDTLFGPKCDISYYDSIASEMGVTRAFVIPSVTHELRTKNFVEKSCIWEVRNGKTTYRRELLYPDGKKKIEMHPKNPYHLMNLHALETIRSLNKRSKIKYHLLAKVHPLLDDEREVRSLLAEGDVVGIKINGIATHTIPEEVPEWIAEVANKSKKVVFVHTDYLDRKFVRQGDLTNC